MSLFQLTPAQEALKGGAGACDKCNKETYQRLVTGHHGMLCDSCREILIDEAKERGETIHWVSVPVSERTKCGLKNTGARVTPMFFKQNCPWCAGRINQREIAATMRR